MKMKRALNLLAVGVIGVSMLSGCSGGDSGAADGQTANDGVVSINFPTAATTGAVYPMGRREGQRPSFKRRRRQP